MNTPLITWICIMSLVALIFIVNALYSYLHRTKGHKRNIMELGQEHDLFFIPGDPTAEEINKYHNDYYEEI